MNIKLDFFKVVKLFFLLMILYILYKLIKKIINKEIIKNRFED